MARSAGAPAVEDVVGPFGFRSERADGTQNNITSFVVDGTHANRALIVAIYSEEGGTPTEAAVTNPGIAYGGVALTHIGNAFAAAGTASNIELWQLLNPTAQTADITFSSYSPSSMNDWLGMAFYFGRTSGLDTGGIQFIAGNSTQTSHSNNLPSVPAQSLPFDLANTGVAASGITPTAQTGRSILDAALPLDYGPSTAGASGSGSYYAPTSGARTNLAFPWTTSTSPVRFMQVLAAMLPVS